MNTLIQKISFSWDHNHHNDTTLNWLLYSMSKNYVECFCDLGLVAGYCFLRTSCREICWEQFLLQCCVRLFAQFPFRACLVTLVRKSFSNFLRNFWQFLAHNSCSSSCMLNETGICWSYILGLQEEWRTWFVLCFIQF